MFAGWFAPARRASPTTAAPAAAAPADQVSQQLSVARRGLPPVTPARCSRPSSGSCELDPQNVEATTYLGWLIVISGAQTGRSDLVDLGVAQLRHAIDIDTTYTDAHCLSRGLRQPRGDARPGRGHGRAYRLPANDPPQDVRGLVEPLLASLGHR